MRDYALEEAIEEFPFEQLKAYKFSEFPNVHAMVRAVRRMAQILSKWPWEEEVSMYDSGFELRRTARGYRLSFILYMSRGDRPVKPDSV